MSDHTPTARDNILTLIAIGASIIPLADAESNIHRATAHARAAHGYFNAATALLGVFGALHNELIEHPDFIALRRFTRRFCI
jgi:hypothetical protein